MIGALLAPVAGAVVAGFAPLTGAAVLVPAGTAVFVAPGALGAVGVPAGAAVLPVGTAVAPFAVVAVPPVGAAVPVLAPVATGTGAGVVGVAVAAFAPPEGLAAGHLVVSGTLVTARGSQLRTDCLS